MAPALASSFTQISEMEQEKQSVVQILVIHKATGSRASIGSGFLFSKRQIASNYHVVANAVLKPENYEIKLIDSEKKEHSARITHIDIINDLAILRWTNPDQRPPLPSSTHPPHIGEPIYSLGNPLDIGFSMVAGTYNALESDTLVERMHFSAAINHGMSGGPVLNSAHQVIGVNVATTANQISFMVPINKLLSLSRKPEMQGDWSKHIQTQLLAFQQRQFDAIFADPWPLREVGKNQVIAEIAPHFSCWGDSSRNDQLDLTTVVLGCSASQKNYISDDFSSGNIEYETWLLSSNKLSTIKLYNYVQQHLASYILLNASAENLVDNFHCINDFVVNSEAEKSGLKVSFCYRRYRDYPQLMDIFYVASSYQRAHEVMVTNFTLEGVNETMASQFTRHYLRSVKWL